MSKKIYTNTLSNLESNKNKASRQTGVFKKCTLNFLQKCSTSNQIYNITETSLTFGQQRRRFYDLISILEALGICTKVHNDSFIWKGFDHSKNAILEIAKQRGVFDSSKTLDDIVPSDGCISIPRLSEDFLLLFLALETQVLNIISITHFMSRNNFRYKTTRCKLYQVASILEMMGLIRKTKNTSEFILDDQFFISATLKMIPVTASPSSFESLLSRAVPSVMNQTIIRRREAFEVYNRMSSQN